MKTDLTVDEVRSIMNIVASVQVPAVSEQQRAVNVIVGKLQKMIEDGNKDDTGKDNTTSGSKQ